ncbi:ATP-binding protein, partial [Streptomyces sp. NPDC002574]|uniref:ATP-binding protein n=1 Tax=Streptomyces sp. NPDC002574 TaxID=3364652 RepID=UPI00369D08E8
MFTQRLSSTRRGVRLARLLAVEALVAWGYARDSELTLAAAQIVPELAANAATHGRVPGRDIEVRLTLDGRVLRIAVCDARGDRLPQPGRTPACADTGRGLLLVAALASRWGTPRYLFRGPAMGPLASGPGMTVAPCRRYDLGGG